MDRMIALVLAGGRGEDFGALSSHRTKAAFPLGGYNRIIDFVLSNLCHSGVRRAGVIIQYLPASLMDHIGSGHAWDFGMADRRLHLMTPWVGVNETRWFRGSGDAIAKNLNLLRSPETDDVMVLSGEHAYRMDYRKLLTEHRQSGADVTFACVEIPCEQHHPRFGSLTVDSKGRVTRFVEKPQAPIGPLVSMGIFCFKRDVLIDLIEHQVARENKEYFSLAGDILQPNVTRLNCRAWVFDAPWHYIADLAAYFELHMEIAAGRIVLQDQGWDVITNLFDRNLGSRPPAYFAPACRVSDAVISPGCKIYGRVENCVLSPGVVIEADAIVRNAVILHDARVERGARVENAIVDKDAIVKAGCSLGKPRKGNDPHFVPIVIPKGLCLTPAEAARAETPQPVGV